MMIEALKQEDIVNKVGGRFKLSTLIQKRLVAINAGARPLVNIETNNLMEIVVEEILQDKIYLDVQDIVKLHDLPESTSASPQASPADAPAAGGPPELDLDAL